MRSLEAGLAAFDGRSFERIAPSWRWELAEWAVSLVNRAWNARMLPGRGLALRACRRGRRARLPDHLRLSLAEILVHRGESEQARRF